MDGGVSSAREPEPTAALRAADLDFRELLRALEPVTPADFGVVFRAGVNESELCETLLAHSSRIEAAIELEIGEGLAAMTTGDRLISRGFSNLGDYAREILDIRPRTAQALAQLARELRSRPLLRAAVRAGEVCVRAAQTVLPVAKGEGEAEWVERARNETVRALAVAVEEAGQRGEEEERWTRFVVRLSGEDRATVDEALHVAGKLDPRMSRHERLEAMAQEYLGEHPFEVDGAGRERFGGDLRAPVDLKDLLEARLESETGLWSYLRPAVRVPAPDAGFDDATSSSEIDARLRALARFRDGWDRAVGFCAEAVKRYGMWRTAGFASFEHYSRERLGMSERAVEQRAVVEERLWARPSLRAARDGGLSYEKVRLLSALAESELESWIARARTLTCVQLNAALEEREARQMRAANLLRARVPLRVASVLDDACEAVRRLEGWPLDAGRCLVRIAQHFIEVWKPAIRKARTRSQRVRDRDLGRCQAPGCSRRAVHAHHIVPRSQGGSDDDWNLVALCGCHHLRGIHGGWIRVRGRAPDAIAWEVDGTIWKDGDFGRSRPGPLAA